MMLALLLLLPLHHHHHHHQLVPTARGSGACLGCPHHSKQGPRGRKPRLQCVGRHHRDPKAHALSVWLPPTGPFLPRPCWLLPSNHWPLSRCSSPIVVDSKEATPPPRSHHSIDRSGGMWGGQQHKRARAPVPGGEGGEAKEYQQQQQQAQQPNPPTTHERASHPLLFWAHLNQRGQTSHRHHPLVPVRGGVEMAQLPTSSAH
jgi:hypothetical protein